VYIYIYIYIYIDYMQFGSLSFITLYVYRLCAIGLGKVLL